MTTDKKKEIIDLTAPTELRIIAVDVGTMNLVLAQKMGDKVEFSTIRNMFLTLDKDQVAMAELSSIDYVESDDHIYIVGSDAFNFSNIIEVYLIPFYLHNYSLFQKNANKTLLKKIL